MNLGRTVLALALVFVAGWIVYILTLVPATVDPFVGTSFLVFGALCIVFHEGMGSSLVAQGTSGPALIARFWNQIGERGARLFYLGVGVFLLVAGCVTWIRILGSSTSV